MDVIYRKKIFGFTYRKTIYHISNPRDFLFFDYVLDAGVKEIELDKYEDVCKMISEKRFFIPYGIAVVLKNKKKVQHLINGFFVYFGYKHQDFVDYSRKCENIFLSYLALQFGPGSIIVNLELENRKFFENHQDELPYTLQHKKQENWNGWYWSKLSNNLYISDTLLLQP